MESARQLYGWILGVGLVAIGNGMLVSTRIEANDVDGVVRAGLLFSILLALVYTRFRRLFSPWPSSSVIFFSVIAIGLAIGAVLPLFL